MIGGANLMGGEGGAYGAFIGAALIEVIRNSLLMAGVDANWQGAFVGALHRSRGSAPADPRQARRPERPAAPTSSETREGPAMEETHD